MIIGCVADPGETDNVRLLRRLYAAWNAGDREASFAMLDPDFEFVNPPNAVEPGTRHGHAGLRTVMENLEGSFDEQDYIVEEIVDLGGNRILCHIVFRARGRDSGARVEIPEQHLWTLRDGKLLRHEWFHDRAAAEQAARQ